MNTNFYDPAFWSRVQFGFTVTYHYLVYWKWRALRTGDKK